MINFITDKLKDTGKTVFTSEDMYKVIGVGEHPKNDSTLKLLCQILLRELVRDKRIFRPRKNIYTLSEKNYSSEELGCVLYDKSYVSFETVLEKHGMLKNKPKVLTFASYVSRTLKVSGKTLNFKELKNDILLNKNGLEGDSFLQATKERAFLDLVYLNTLHNNFANLEKLDLGKIKELVPIYDNKKFEERVRYILKMDKN